MNGTAPAEVQCPYCQTIYSPEVIEQKNCPECNSYPPGVDIWSEAGALVELLETAAYENGIIQHSEFKSGHYSTRGVRLWLVERQGTGTFRIVQTIMDAGQCVNEKGDQTDAFFVDLKGEPDEAFLTAIKEAVEWLNSDD